MAKCILTGDHINKQSKEISHQSAVSDDLLSRLPNRNPLEVFTGLIVFIVCCSVYGMTMSRTISGGDAGELAVSACRLGVAHPPGYPLFTLLYHWTWRCLSMAITQITPALSFNMLSVLLTSLGITLLYFSIIALVKDPFIALTTSLMFGFSPTPWLYSGQAEVFALHIFMIALLIRFGVWVHDRPGIGRVAICAFASGIAMTNQHTSIFFIGPIAFHLFITNMKLMSSPLPVAIISLSFLAGLTPYVWLPIASYHHAMDAWGDQSTLQGFLHHILRSEYGTLQLAASEISTHHSMIVRLGIYLTHLASDSLYLYTFLALIGALTGLGSHYYRHPLEMGLILSYTTYIGIFHYLANLDLTPLLLGVQMRFWMQPNMIVFIFAGIGWKRLRRHTGRIIDALCIVMLSIQLARGIVSRDFSEADVVAQYGQLILDSLPDRAVVLLNGDLNNNAVKYLSGCENKSLPGQHLLSLQLMSWDWFVESQSQHYPGIRFPGRVYHPFKPNGFTIAEFIEANQFRFPIYLCGNWKYGDGSHEGRYELIPSGICNQIVKLGQRSKSSRFSSIRRAASFVPLIAPLPGPISSDLWESVIYSDLFHRRLALFHEAAVHVAEQPNQSADDLAFAAFLAETVFYSTPDGVGVTQIDMYRNAGVVFGLYSVHNRTSESNMLRAWQLYVELDPNHDVQVEQIVKLRWNPYRNTAII